MSDPAEVIETMRDAAAHLPPLYRRLLRGRICAVLYDRAAFARRDEFLFDFHSMSSEELREVVGALEEERAPGEEGLHLCVRSGTTNGATG